MKNLILSVLTFIMISPFTQAAESDGGHGGSGGDGYKCAKSKDDLVYPPYNLHLVDTYGDTSLDDIVDGNYFQLRQPFGMRTLGRFINRKMPAAVYPHPFKPGVRIPFGTFITLRYLQMYFYHSDYSQLPDLWDDNIWFWQVPRGCKKVQLAVQDIKNSVVRLSEYIPNLPVMDRLFLDLHETLLSIRNQPGLDTTPIRRDVKRLANMVRFHRSDFIRGLTKDYEAAVNLDVAAYEQNKPALKVPRALRCKTTWRMPRIDEYQPKFQLASAFLLERVRGSGSADDKNIYQLKTAPGVSAQSYLTEMFQQETVFSNLVASEINAFETKFEIPRGVTYTVAIYDLFDEVGVYYGNVQASFTNKNVAMKSRQQSTHEMYSAAGLACVPL